MSTGISSHPATIHEDGLAELGSASVARLGKIARLGLFGVARALVAHGTRDPRVAARRYREHAARYDLCTEASRRIAATPVRPGESPSTAPVCRARDRA
jgi:hypothetical protein